jgi:LemA protein
VEILVTLFIELIALAPIILAGIIGTVGSALAAIVLLIWLIRALFFRKSPQIDGADVISPADRVNRMADKEMSSTTINIEKKPGPTEVQNEYLDDELEGTKRLEENAAYWRAREEEPRKDQDQLSNGPEAGATPNSRQVLFVVLSIVISLRFFDYYLPIFLLSVIALVVGFYALTFARNMDRKNYVIQKATPMSLAMVNERDDVWLRGVTECESPLVAPHFDVTCLFYYYERQLQKTRILYTRDFPYFKTEKVWICVEKKSEDTSLFLRDGEHVIDIDGNAGNLIDHRESHYEKIGKIAHSLTYVPHPLELSAVGSISEGKHRLEEHANIPLLVTTEERKESIRAAEDDEEKALYTGFFFSWFGLAGLFGMFGSHFELLASLPAIILAFYWRRLKLNNLFFPLLGVAGLFLLLPMAPRSLPWSAVFPTIIVTLYWGMLKHNILIDYRNRVENAWKQVDVDLAMRYKLIPNLVATVKGAMNHERESITRLVKLRTKAIANKEDKLRLESEIVESVRTIVARVERYPNLTAQGTTGKLIRQLCAIEEKIAHGRTVYNDAVHEYNNNVSMFPQRLIAEKFGFESHQFFTIPAKEVALPNANWV